MWVFALLLGGSALFSAGFALDLGRPWRSEVPSMAWLQAGLAWAAAAVDVSLLLAVFGVHVPVWVYVAVLLAQNAVFGWRWFVLRRARRDDAINPS
jgi:hypothetical protein